MTQYDSAPNDEQSTEIDYDPLNPDAVSESRRGSITHLSTVYNPRMDCHTDHRPKRRSRTSGTKVVKKEIDRSILMV